MDINNVVKRAMKTYKIKITTKRNAFLEEATRAFREICKTRNGRTVMALYLGDLKKMIPDIEVYIDEASHLLAPDLIARCITESIVHENCHAEGFNERQAGSASKTIMKLLKPMVWKLIKCPKKKANISWEECLRCSDDEKTDDCPILPIREMTREREYKPNEYHVTELIHLRRAYFNRTIGYAKGWEDDDYISLIIGKGTHHVIQSGYPRREVEVAVAHDFYDFKVVGSIDILPHGALYDLKTYAWLGLLIQRGKPDADHVFQVQAYYSLLRVTQPWLAQAIKKLKIIYLGKTKRESRQYVEFTVEAKDILNEIKSRAQELHDALKSGTPPAKKCPTWLCAFCEYTEPCEGIGHGFKKDDKTFKRFLIQHKRGVERAAEILREKGHAVEVNPLAVSDVVISDPAQKQRPEWDIEDLTTKEKIDVKTTSRPDMWCNAAQLIKAADLDLVYYFFFVESGEIRRIRAKKLYAARKTAKRDTNQFGEAGFIFSKDVAGEIK